MQKIQGERITVKLKNLRFGHEAPVHPSNARVTGRLDGVPELAANFFSRGMIEDLIVFDDGVRADGETIYFVSDGNRSLAALRMVFGEPSEEPIDCKLRPAKEAFEDSLAVAVMSRKLHPVDEYEGFARLKDQGKTDDEIARQYGLTALQVQRVLALGHLSPTIRNAWRNREIKTEVAKAFTMAPDQASQNRIFAELSKQQEENGRGLADLEDYEVRDALKVSDGDDGMLVEFVGIDDYVKRGGKVTRDLFGTDHKVSDTKLLKAMAAKRLEAECEKLKAQGWSFAVPRKGVKNPYDYSELRVTAEPTPEEEARMKALEAIFEDPDNPSRDFDELTPAEQAAYTELRAIETAIGLRPYTKAMMAKAGCFVEIGSRGQIKVDYGKVKPAQKAEAAKEVNAAKRESARAAVTAAAEGKPAPEQTVISNALRDRLEAALVAGTRDAIGTAIEATDLLKSPLAQLLGKIVCAQITVNGSLYSMPDSVRTRLVAIREALPALVVNNAILKRFDADDYFGNAPKAVLIKAIAEAINPDEARKAAAGSKSEVGKFALKNLGKTGWVPREMRTPHFVMPKIAKTAAVPAKPAAPAKASPAVSPAMRTALSKAKKALAPIKRAAAVKKAAAKKTSAKKGAAKKKR